MGGPSGPGGGDGDTCSIPEVQLSVQQIRSRPLFLLLEALAAEHGPIFTLVVGPKRLLVLSDRSMVRHVLTNSPEMYGKGILAEIIEFIMGKGVLPADGEHWKARRRVVAPALQRKFVSSVVDIFAGSARRGMELALEPAAAAAEAAASTSSRSSNGSSSSSGGNGSGGGAQGGATVEVESFFSRMTLESLGRAVFDYEFKQGKEDDPVIQAVYAVLLESTMRSTAPLPYWKLPGAVQLVPRLRAAQAHVDLLNATLDRLIAAAREQLQRDEVQGAGRQQQQQEDGHVSDGSSSSSSSAPAVSSVLQFLVAGGEDLDSSQLRDDLMTLLIAGHETTAAALSWALLLLARNPRVLAEMRKEVDSVLGDRAPTPEDVPLLRYTARVLCESLRMYPQPPLLIRRALQDDVLVGDDGRRFRVRAGADLFLPIHNVHRNPALWEQPQEFRPERFGPLDGPMPSETTTDWAFMPFGGGKRRCLGDIFAMTQAVVLLAMVVRRYDFVEDPQRPVTDVKSGATIHSKHGIHMYVSRRDMAGVPPPAPRPAAAADGGGEGMAGMCPHAAAAAAGAAAVTEAAASGCPFSGRSQA